MNYYESKCDGIAHVIRKGDTLYRLGRMYGVSVESIMEANPGARVYHLVPGETLCIPMAMGKMPEMPGSEHMSSPGSMPGQQRMSLPGNMPGQESDRPGWDVIIPYTVREGESLNSLLETFHMDFSDFEKLNPELMPILLTPGEKVYVKRNRTVVMEEQ